MPAVPPYSSTTTAIVRPARCNSMRTVSRCMEAGTTGAGMATAPTRAVSRASTGTRRVSLTCPMPTTLSRSPSYTGNREWPVSTASRRNSDTVASAGRPWTATRGTITSAASFSTKAIARVRREVSWAPSSPSAEEARTIISSSWSERSPINSSRGWMPRRRTVQLAEALKNWITGRSSRLTVAMGRPTRMALG